MQSAILQEVVCPTKRDPVFPYLLRLLANARIRRATDLILRPASEGHCLARIMGVLQRATDLDTVTDDRGCLLPDFRFEDIAQIILGSDRMQGTKVYRLKDLQVRVHVANAKGQPRRIFLRVQPLVPPSLSALFTRFPNTLQHMREASGLVVVCGPIGSGKSTLAASTALCWAESGRHIMTIEDPVEYDLRATNGLVTHQDASFLPRAPGDGGAFRPTLQDLIPDALRGDIDGLYIGETRHATTLETALEFAGAREPVITTFHAGSIADCIIRMITMASSIMPEPVARLTISQCLHSIIYTNLSYGAGGQIIPTMMVLPVNNLHIRKLLAGVAPSGLHGSIDNALAQRGAGSASINRDTAKSEAIAGGGMPESVEAALPPVRSD